MYVTPRRVIRSDSDETEIKDRHGITFGGRLARSAGSAACMTDRASLSHERCRKIPLCPVGRRAL